MVVGGHAQGLFLRVQAVPGEGESVLGFGFDEPLDGGKGSNQAVAAARLGARVALVTVLGRDERGRRAIDFFAEQSIDTSWIVEVDGPTDVGFVMLPPSAIPAIATAMERNRELTAATVERAAPVLREASVVLSQLETPQEAALAAFRIVRAAGALTILNPSPATDLDPELVALADLLVPNEHEAADLAGHAGHPGELASELSGRFIEGAVIVTAGADGAYVSRGGAPSAHVEAPTCKPVDTTGAGDAFVGALAVRLRAGDELDEAVSFAVRAASLSVTRAGTMLAFPTADELSV